MSPHNPSPPTPSATDADDRFARILTELKALRELLHGSRKPLLTIDEVARLTGRNPYTVRTWVKTGRLAATRVHGTGPRGRLLVARDELDRLLTDGLAGRVPGTALAHVASDGAGS